ncbi:nucleotidyltransferase family protein [Altericista sp. CCNU0014]|uniref:nucleotidyltransferase domain-containing protein n=1 Tax=Altericista sp. CCNU0014 TaxID=3082949 RepID=UPI00384EC0CB
MLLRTLLQLSLTSADASRSNQFRQQLNAASDRDWQEVSIDLELHRLMPFVYYGIKVHGLKDCVPKSILDKLLNVYISSLGRNQVLLNTLAAVLKATYEAGVRPVLWKGVVLVDQLYPDRAVRMMGDIDWAIAPHELETVSRVFERLGFTIKDRLTTPDAVYFMGQNRVFFDVHHRVRLFEGKEHLPLTQNLTSALGGLSEICALEPTAMLTHLTVHLAGHMAETGPLLFWILDFVFLLRKWGHLIDGNRLDRLMPSENWLFLGRLLHFLEVEFNEPLPPDLAKLAREHKPLTLESITRQSRLAVWGLPHPRGWLKLMAYRLGLKSPSVQKFPRASDLVLWASDVVSAVH